MIWIFYGTTHCTKSALTGVLGYSLDASIARLVTIQQLQTTRPWKQNIEGSTVLKIIDSCPLVPDNQTLDGGNKQCSIIVPLGNVWFWKNARNCAIILHRKGRGIEDVGKLRGWIGQLKHIL